MYVAAAIAMILLAFALPIAVRAKHVPPDEPLSPTRHLEERKAAVYDNLRDLHSEFQMGKMSEADYAASKRDLQAELAGVMEAIEEAERSGRA